MRQDYSKFVACKAQVMIVGPDGPNAFRRYWEENDMPFPGLADTRSRVATQYGQEVKLLKFGRMPAIFIVDKEGKIHFAHYGDSMVDYPTNDDLLTMLNKISG